MLHTFLCVRARTAKENQPFTVRVGTLELRIFASHKCLLTMLVWLLEIDKCPTIFPFACFSSCTQEFECTFLLMSTNRKRARNSSVPISCTPLQDSGVASKYAEYALGREPARETPKSDSTLEAEKTEEAVSSQAPAKRAPSALDILMWKESACEQQTLRKKPNICAKRTNKNETQGHKQLFLDFGQKNFSSRTCSVCNMVYCPGLPEEELMHRREHKRVTEGVEFRYAWTKTASV
jgi:hypothetical protein